MKYQSFRMNQFRAVLKFAVSASNLQLSRQLGGKHFNPKWKSLRKKKFMYIRLPDLNEDTENISKEELRKKMKDKDLQPPRPWNERSFYISCTGDIFEGYVPPEGDGKMSGITPSGAKQKLQFLEKKSRSMMAIRKVKSYDDDFETDKFCEDAVEIYLKAHTALATKDRLSLRQFVTERAYPEFRYNTLDKTINWKFIKSLEPPRIVHARCTDVISKSNIYAQITVRFHTQQQLAIYDRFGRLMHGSEILAKDVLEYVVFEKHLSNLYGSWRIHAKIIPDWMPPKDPALITYLLPDRPADVGLTTEKEKPEEALPEKVDESKPQIAAA